MFKKHIHVCFIHNKVYCCDLVMASLIFMIEKGSQGTCIKLVKFKLVQNTIESLKFVGANILGLLKINLQIHGDVISCMSFYLYRVVSKTQGAGNSPANNALITRLLLLFKHNVAKSKTPRLPCYLFISSFYYNF